MTTINTCLPKSPSNISPNHSEVICKLQIPDSRLKPKGFAKGGEGSSQERAVILADFSRQLSRTAWYLAVNAYSACLLAKWISRVDEGPIATKRRAWFKMEDERIEEETRAYWHVYVRSLGKARDTCKVK